MSQPLEHNCHTCLHAFKYIISIINFTTSKLHHVGTSIHVYVCSVDCILDKYMFWATRDDVFTSSLWIMFRQAASCDCFARFACGFCLAVGERRASSSAAAASFAATRRATMSAALSDVQLDLFDDIVDQCRGSSMRFFQHIC
jgi:hypothetical protein